jgi:hypothetical protein
MPLPGDALVAVTSFFLGALGELVRAQEEQYGRRMRGRFCCGLVLRRPIGRPSDRAQEGQSSPATTWIGLRFVESAGYVSRYVSQWGRCTVCSHAVTGRLGRAGVWCWRLKRRVGQRSKFPAIHASDCVCRTSKTKRFPSAVTLPHNPVRGARVVRRSEGSHHSQTSCCRKRGSLRPGAGGPDSRR